MALIRLPKNQSGTVFLHVQAFADAVSKATGADSFGTYLGHDPTLERALDIFTPTDSRKLGDAICDFAIANLKRFGVDYVIYRQRIFNPEIAPVWRDMADRGDLTNNHFDHVHVSFEATAPGPFDSVPAPTIAGLLEGETSMETIFYQFKKEDWFFDRASKTFGRLPFGSLIEGLAAHGLAKKLGPVDESFHTGVRAWVAAAGFSQVFADVR